MCEIKIRSVPGVKTKATAETLMFTCPARNSNIVRLHFLHQQCNNWAAGACEFIPKRPQKYYFPVPAMYQTRALLWKAFTFLDTQNADLRHNCGL